MLTRIIKIITWGFFLLAIWIIAKEIKMVGIKDLTILIQRTPLWVIGIAGIGILINYGILSEYDFLALSYIGKKLPFKDVFKTACISFAFSNTTGHTYAAGGAIRYWFYIPKGVSKADILKMILFETLTVLIGIGVSFLIAVGLLPMEHITGKNEFYIIGSGIGILMFFYICEIIIPKRKIHIKKIILPAPTIKMTIKQAITGLLDNILLFLIFYIFLRYHLNIHFFETFSIFIIAQSIGYMAQVPGGLGVFEGAFLYLYPHTAMEKSGILASLILFRIFYYFVPFSLAMGYFGIRFLRQKHIF